MSVDESFAAPAARGLGEYIIALVAELGAANPAALARMRQVVGLRRARIKLDDETVDVFFDPIGLRVQTATLDSPIDGMGETDSTTVLALLDGYLEVGSAILNGQLSVSGEPDDITRMFMAIEILLDASPRTPALQQLAAQFRRARRATSSTLPRQRPRPAWYPFGSSAREMDLLRQHELLPDETTTHLKLSARV